MSKPGINLNEVAKLIDAECDRVRAELKEEGKLTDDQIEAYINEDLQEAMKATGYKFN